jgi:TetR/AcrR family transcriptional repressor of nem operon
VHITWLAKVLASAGIVNPNIAKERAQAIYAAITGAQLMARGRFDLSLFDTLITSYRATGLLPA